MRDSRFYPLFSPFAKILRFFSFQAIAKILLHFSQTSIFVTWVFNSTLANQVVGNSQSFDPCSNTRFYHKVILDEIVKNNLETFADLPQCFKNDQKLIIKAVIINHEIFSQIDEKLQSDWNFVKRLVKVNPLVLELTPPEITKDANFMEEMTYIYRDALKYASWSLLDNRQFMTKLIDYDSQNYKYASDRIRSIEEIALMAFRDNGLMLKYAPYSLKNDPKIVEKALNSDPSALEFASKKLRNDEELKKITDQQDLKIDLEKLEQFIKRNYFIKNPQRNLEDLIANQGKFYGKRQIFNRNYLTKWQRKIGDIDPVFRNYQEEFKMVAVDSRNFQTNFKEDLKNFPKLVNKITKFLKKHRVDDNTIDNLKITYLWKISEKPLTFAMNLYFLRDSSDIDLGSDFANISSLTIVVGDIASSKDNTNDDELTTESNQDSQPINKLTKNNKSSKKITTKKLPNNNQPKDPQQENKIDEILESFKEDNLASKDDLDQKQEEDSQIINLADNSQKLIFDEDIQIDELNPESEDNDLKKDTKDKKTKNQKNNKDKKTVAKNISKKTTNDDSNKKQKSKPDILENKNSKWNLSVIEAIFDSETRMDPSYRNGHKRYVLWDLYKTQKDDKNPKLIYRVEDQIKDYFIVFARQKNNKYQQIFTTQKSED